MPFTTFCPACKARHHLPQEWQGREFTCKVCGQPFAAKPGTATATRRIETKTAPTAAPTDPAATAASTLAASPSPSPSPLSASPTPSAGELGYSVGDSAGYGGYGHSGGYAAYPQYTQVSSYPAYAPYWGAPSFAYAPPGIDACAECGSIAEATDRYCFNCGVALPEGSSARHMTWWSLFRKHEEIRSLQGNLRAARRSVAVVALCFLALFLFVLPMAHQFGLAPAEERALLATLFIMTAMFFGLWVWAKRRPLPAIAATALIMITMSFNALVMSGFSPILLVVLLALPVAVLFFLISGFKAAVTYTRAMSELSALRVRLSEQR